MHIAPYTDTIKSDVACKTIITTIPSLTLTPHCSNTSVPTISYGPIFPGVKCRRPLRLTNANTSPPRKRGNPGSHAYKNNEKPNTCKIQIPKPKTKTDTCREKSDNKDIPDNKLSNCVINHSFFLKKIILLGK